MKKLIELLVAVALLVSASATVFALSSSPTSTNKSGLNVDSDSKSYSYYCELSASTSSASSRMTYGRSSTSINCTLRMAIKYNDKSFSGYDITEGTSSIKLTLDNHVLINNLWLRGTIHSVSSDYKIITKQVASLNLT